MYVSHRDDIERMQISEMVTKQRMVTPQQGWETHVMRLFTLAPNGAAPHHSHDWEHIVYVLEGEGNLYLEGQDHPLTAGSVAYVPAQSDHQIANRGSGDFVFICIVPQRGDH